MAAKDYTGSRFGALIAIAPHHTNGRRWFWTAKCDCGTTKIVRMEKLVSGKIISCGCLQHHQGAGGAGHPSYGPNGPYVEWSNWIGSRTYKTWSSMLSRCENPNHHAYEYYGATGISVCERWHKFGNFLADMGERPPGMTIDRWPDKYGSYEPGNCRWATPKEQANNSRPWGTVAAKKFPKK